MAQNGCSRAITENLKLSMNRNAKIIQRYLAMPELLQQLGLRYTPAKSLCPLHKDHFPTFTVWQNHGSWFWQCHAGCGRGDEIDFLSKFKGISRSEATELYHEMAHQRRPL